MNEKYEKIDRFIEYGIYIYIIFMFLTKGEAVRNVLIFGNFTLWLFTLKHRKNLYILKDPVSIFFAAFLGLTVFSVIFSIDPFYSFLELREDPLKAALLFPVISTVMADRKRLNKLVYITLFTLVFIVLIGYYSYFFHNVPFLKPDTALMHTGATGYNRFVIYLNTLLPFAFIPVLLRPRIAIKVLLGFLLLISVIAVILTTSRMGLIGLFCIVLIWSLYFSKIKNYNFIRIISGIIAVMLIIVTISWFSSSHLRDRIFTTSEQLQTVNLRTEAWKPAILAISQRPVFGWGYGKQIFFQDEPFKDTYYKKAPAMYPKNIHNVFIKILFHQGIISLIPYIFLIIFAIRYFWKNSFQFKDIRSYILIASVSVLLSNYIVHSMTEEVPNLRALSIILSLGVAAKFTNENSNN